MSGRLRDARVSSTVARKVSWSPGRTGLSHRTSSMALAPMDDESSKKPSHIMRIMMPAGVPARRREPAQHGLARGILVEMHRLRIEFGGEGDDFLARDQARTVFAEQAGLEVFEIEFGHRHQFLRGAMFAMALRGVNWGGVRAGIRASS